MHPHAILAPDALLSGPERLTLLLSASHILVVDDEEANVRLLRTLLGRVGYRSVATLTDPLKLEREMEKHQPDLVLLDLHMPHRDGFEVLAALHPWIEAEHLPVLMVTGDISIDARRRALSLGARDFVNKPYDAVEISLRVRNLLETRLLYQDLRKRNRALMDAVHGRTLELESARLEMLERLAIAAEYRDDNTSRHTMRVGAMAGRLAGALGLSDDFVALMTRAGALHDVGKIGIPDALLLKPGPLTSDEVAVMRTHTTIGAHILGGSDAPLLQLAEIIARSHHERWDGRGYPNGLAGDAIPLPGRVVAVADAFDALTNDRPYRRGRGVGDALEEIRRHRGTQFDVSVVEALLSVVPELDTGSDERLLLQ